MGFSQNADCKIAEYQIDIYCCLNIWMFVNSQKVELLMKKVLVAHPMI